jgi:alpha-glucosidase (family GH31 glycosyl hydrolase)
MIRTLFLLAFLLACETTSNGQQMLGSYSRHRFESRSLVFESGEGQQLRVTPYGTSILRVQAVRNGEKFFPDDRCEMVEKHNWPGSLRLSDEGESFVATVGPDSTLTLRITKHPMRLSFFVRGISTPLLSDSTGIWWGDGEIHCQFHQDSNEHFTGLGHGFFGRAEHIDLRGETIGRNYGTEHGQQAPLIVPFYLSSKGYGIFLNSTFPNSFSFDGIDGYAFSLAGNARMDYFFIAGPEFPDILDRYTMLTGRPRFPPLAVFGLALSDKANDRTSRAPSDELWWKAKVAAHRAAGFAIDHLVNDNRWRACGGTRCESCFAWDTTRFPDPAEYERWISNNGLIATLDFNRCIAHRSDGWIPSFNIPHADSIEFGDSAPDFTRPEVRAWFWNLMWQKSLNPQLKYPGDALWIDEFDELGKAPDSMVLGNGRTWREMKNYWFFLIAKSLVQEGWDRAFGASRRPFVWVRGMTAGAQRYATLWSGDIRPTYEDMQGQVRSMQLAGMSGFPYWGHDAGGFYDWRKNRGPDEMMYRRWSMAFGSFTPFWKPHGMGQSRWPLDRSAESQEDARLYIQLRYRLMPYIYTCAYEAHERGLPMARAMVITYRELPDAWSHDLEYMWGDAFLVAPQCLDDSLVAVWLPPGNWYEFWTDRPFAGDRVVHYASSATRLPLLVRGGAIVPMVPPALSTASLHRDTLYIHVYTGKDGRFVLYEDDGVSERFRTTGEKRTTTFTFNNEPLRVKIAGAVGRFSHAPEARTYRIQFHGLAGAVPLIYNGVPLPQVETEHPSGLTVNCTVWNEKTKCLSVFLANIPVNRKITVERANPTR